jgi:L-asparaginase
MNAKPYVCLIYTGGTIAMEYDYSEETGSRVLRPPRDPRKFLQRVAPEFSNQFDYDFVTLEYKEGGEGESKVLNKDSTNMNPNDWTTIAEGIVKQVREHEGRYDGFVIAHGTDTMHFSASAVAFALGKHLKFPVVFTGAQTYPDVQHGDARVNLFRACQIASQDFAEVVISFGEYVFRGCRAQKKDEARFDAFESPSCPPLAYITEKIVSTNLGVRRPTEPSASYPDPSKAYVGDIDLRANFAPGVFQVSLIPGLEPELLKPIVHNPACTGLILQSFGAGNVPDQAPYSFSKIIQEATEKGVPVIITSQFPANATLHTAYAPGQNAVKAGAIPTGNMTSSCAVAKFRWVLAQLEAHESEASRIEKVKRMMETEYVHEMDVDEKQNHVAEPSAGKNSLQ